MTKLRLKTLPLAVLGMWMAGSVMAEEHYLVGGATDSGWNAGEYNRSAVAMVKVSGNEWIWCGKLTVNDGDDDAKRFKIPDGYDSWNGYWAPEQNMALPMNGTDFVNLSTNSNGDYKFKVQETGYYKVTIYTGENPKMTAKKLTDLNPTNGYYEINSLDAYYWFAAYIATEDTKASKARLTANLDFSGEGFFPLASDKHKFQGEFDGGGHKVSGINASGDYKAMGFFRYATGGAYIHDLVIEGSFTGGVKVAGVIGYAHDGGTVTLKNIINEANVTATRGTTGNEGNAAGLVACASNSTIIAATNCANMGKISGQDGQCAAFAGWTLNGSSFTNCWNNGVVNNGDNNNQLCRTDQSITLTNCYDLSSTTGIQGTTLDAATLGSGELCYKLNGNVSAGTNWYQNLSGESIDTYPVPFSSHALVYGNGDLRCDGVTPKEGSNLTFANSEGAGQVDDHSYENGFCTFCDKLQEGFMSPTDDIYLIGDEHQLRWFAEYVNLGNNTIKGKLTADINYTSKQSMIGNADEDGKRYKGHFNGQGHTVTVLYNRSEKFAALFGVLGDGAIVENLRTAGAITTSNQHAAGIAGGARGNAQIRNCISAVDITGTGSGDGTHAGICGFMFDTGSITNCAFVGSLTAENCTGNAGLLGYANGGDNIVLTNCYVYADFKYKSENSDSWAMKRHTNSLRNCYYIEKTKDGNFQIVNDMSQLANKDSFKDNSIVNSGELCYKLNDYTEAWHQTLGTDAHPVPFSTDDHLTVSESDGDYYNTLYEVANASELVIFANRYNNGSLTNGFYKVCLTGDIDFTSVNDFPGIGTNDNRFRGIFDGQKHRISNLHMTIDEDAVGFFRYVTSGGTVIKRFTIDNTCSFSGKAGVGAFVGRAEGRNGDRDLTFEGLGNEANVTANGANGGGILGVDMNSDAVITIKNCYNTGAIKSSNEGGAFSGWLGDNSKVINCYNMGTIENGSGLYRSTATQNENTFSTTERQGNCGDNYREATTIYTGNDAGKFSDGTVFASLFDYNNNGVNGNVWRMEFSDTPHPVLYDAAIVYKEDFPNRPVAQENVDVTLYRTIKAGTWNTFCAPFTVPTSQFTKVVELDTNNPDTEVLHFITASTIEAGKAYLVKTENAISEINASNVTVSPTITSSTAGGYDFTGVYEPTSLPQDAYVFTTRKSDNKDVIIKVEAGTNMNGFRAYLKATSSSPARSFVIDDEITGIITPEGEFIEDGPVYNLGGQRVNKPQRGLYIQNGKKVIR